MRSLITVVCTALLFVSTAFAQEVRPVFKVSPGPNGSILLTPTLNEGATTSRIKVRFSVNEGVYYVTLCWLEKGGIQIADYAIPNTFPESGVSPKPGPGPNPSPEPGPAPIPDPPAPTSKLTVLFLYDASDIATLPLSQSILPTSKELRDYLKSHCEQAGGVPAFRFWDKDVDASKESQSWKDLLATVDPKKVTYPWFIVKNASGIKYAGPWKTNAKDTLDLLKTYGGP